MYQEQNRIHGGVVKNECAPVSNTVQLLQMYLFTGERHCLSAHDTGASMNLIVRHKGSRRLDLPVDYPLTDSEQVVVIHDRRRLRDRRKQKYGRDDLKVILEKMAD